jgi:putative ABC transport system substrate-binding protein
LAGALEEGRRAGADALLVFSSAGIQIRRAELSMLILKHRLPAISTGALAGDPAILASYHNDIVRHVGRAGEIAARILKGTKPADIPVEQPDTFELVLNVKTANALGVKIPYSVLSRATKVIE